MRFGRVGAGNVIDEAIRATADFVATLPGTWVELPYGVGIGWTYSGGVWTGPEGQSNPPEPEAPADRAIYITKMAPRKFIQLFTPAEWRATQNLIATDDVANQTYSALFADQNIDVTEQEIIDFLTALVNGGALTLVRARAIKAGIPAGVYETPAMVVTNANATVANPGVIEFSGHFPVNTTITFDFTAQPGGQNGQISYTTPRPMDTDQVASEIAREFREFNANVEALGTARKVYFRPDGTNVTGITLTQGVIS